MPDVLVQLVPYVEAEPVPVNVALARSSSQVGNILAEDAVPHFGQVKVHLETKILAPGFRKFCDVETILLGKFPQTIVEVPEVSKADANVPERC